MAVPSLRRRGRVAAAGLLLALSGSLVPVATVFAVDVFPATGGSAISADDAGTSNWTILTGPELREAGPGELFTDSTTILNAPSAFRFKPDDGGVILSPGCNMGQTLTITSTQATLKVGSSSTNVPCSLKFILKVQPATGKGLASNHITKTGTSGAPGGGFSYGLLTIVAGAPKSLTWTTQPGATNSAGTAFATAPVVTVKDQFGNSVSKASVTLSIAPGTGPAGAVADLPDQPGHREFRRRCDLHGLQDRHGRRIHAPCHVRRGQRGQRQGHRDRRIGDQARLQELSGCLHATRFVAPAAHCSRGCRW